VLASSLHVAAFSLGNAIGAWLGAMVFSQKPGPGTVTGFAAMLPTP
jgi:predicted MFS family arabinose efflux permease